MSQTGGSHNLPNLLKKRILQFGMLHDEFLGDVVAQRHADTCYLERVGQAVMHEDASRQGEYLGLVLKPTEGSGENQAVIVAFELRSVVVALGVAMLLSETLLSSWRSGWRCSCPRRLFDISCCQFIITSVQK